MVTFELEKSPLISTPRRLFGEMPDGLSGFHEGQPSTNNNVDFQMVRGDCGSLAVKIENPEHAHEKPSFTAVIAALHEEPWVR